MGGEGQEARGGGGYYVNLWLAKVLREKMGGGGGGLRQGEGGNACHTPFP